MGRTKAQTSRLGLRPSQANPIRAWMAECQHLNTLAHLRRACAAMGWPIARPHLTPYARRVGWRIPNDRHRLLLEEASLGGIPAESWYERIDDSEGAREASRAAASH